MTLIEMPLGHLDALRLLDSSVRADIVRILRLAVEEARTRHVIPVRAAALRLGLWGTAASKHAVLVVKHVVEAALGPHARPNIDEYPAFLAEAADLVGAA